MENFPGENAGGKNCQQLLVWSTEPPPRGHHNHPGDRELQNRSSSEWDPGNKPEGSQAEGFGQLCKAAMGRSGLLGWQRIAAGSALHIRDWGEGELPRPLHGPKLQTIPRTLFPVQSKGLEPARNLLRNRILLGSISLQQVWTKPWRGKGEIRLGWGSCELCQGISGYPESCGRAAGDVRAPQVSNSPRDTALQKENQDRGAQLSSCSLCPSQQSPAQLTLSP